MSQPKRPKSSDQDPLGVEGVSIDKRYQVQRRGDQGGYGYVYKARHVMWDKPVAMKFFKRTGDSAKRQSMKVAFIKEGALLSELSRKTTSIVQSRDVGECELPNGTSVLYTVLEWLEGSTLEKVLAAERQAGESLWPMHRVVRTLAPVAEALEVAHNNGVAHRDIKPSNVFIVDENGNEVTKVLDFGIAKVVEGLSAGFLNTSAGTSQAYTPAYAAPEQFAKRHGSTGPWTDVYALALLCVELLVGRHPLGAENFGQLVVAVCDVENRPTPRGLGIELGDDVEEVFSRALSVQADGRYPSVGEFWAALLNTEQGQSALSHIQKSIGNVSMMAPGLRVTPVSGTNTVESPAVTQPAVTVSSPSPARSRRKVTPYSFVVLGAVAGAVAYWQFRPAPIAEVEPAPNTSTASTAAGSAAPVVIDKQPLSSFAVLPTVVNSKTNPVTEKKIALGRRLFYDERLSQNGDLSCNSCHPLDKYGSDGRPVSIGNAGKKGRRNALTIYHAAGAFALFWDGRAASLEQQASMPVINPDEMGMSEDQAVRVLRAIPEYVTAFRDAFPSDGAITMDNVGRAIAAFERKLFTPSPWDDYLNGNEDALNNSQRRGFNAFVEVGCLSCHFGPYVGLRMYQKLGLLRAWPDTKDSGRFEVTKNDADFMVFRVPSLRNIAETGPFFHDGSEPSLENAVRRMATHQLGKELTDAQVTDIVAWLDTLTGKIPAEYIREPSPFASPATAN